MGTMRARVTSARRLPVSRCTCAVSSLMPRMSPASCAWISDTSAEISATPRAKMLKSS